MRVLIVDDSAFMRKALLRILEAAPRMQVVGSAVNGREGVEMAAKLDPDVVTLDIEMPVMDGLTALGHIRKTEDGKEPPAILMCSSLTTAGSHESLKALRLGACDVILKDSERLAGGAGEFGQELVTKIRAIGSQRKRRVRLASGPIKVGEPDAPFNAPPLNRAKLPDSGVSLLAIGSSTGGPPVVERILTALPANCAFPVLVAQHMPALFTKSLAERLNDICAINVELAKDGVEIRPGSAYIGEGGFHIRVAGPSGRLRLDVTPEPSSASFKPSVNELMSSVAKTCPKRSLGVMLTGMGDDGKIGCKALADAGGSVIAQDEASCVVWGMPKAVTVNGCATGVGPPDKLAALLASLAAGRAKPAGGSAGSAGAHPVQAGPGAGSDRENPSHLRWRQRRAS